MPELAAADLKRGHVGCTFAHILSRSGTTLGYRVDPAQSMPRPRCGIRVTAGFGGRYPSPRDFGPRDLSLPLQFPIRKSDCCNQRGYTFLACRHARSAFLRTIEVAQNNERLL